MIRSALSVSLAFALCAAPFTAQAQAVVPSPKMTMTEALQSLEAAGFTLKDGKALNACGRPTAPKFTYVDLNGDGFPEGIATETDATCYGGAYVSVIYRQKSGAWGWLFRTRGTLTWSPARTGGWLNAQVQTTCKTAWAYNSQAGTYFPDGYCAGDEKIDPDGSLGRPNPISYDPAFLAAGFSKKGRKWIGCEGDSTAEIRDNGLRDLNGDGVNELIITEQSGPCYGNTGEAFYVMARGADQKWHKLYSTVGIPTFFAPTVKTPGNWPDIEIGGPGFCFPLYRWNGKAYVFLKKNAYSKGACGGR